MVYKIKNLSHKKHQTTERNWLKELLLHERSGQKGKLRKDNRIMSNGMLWILQTGYQWRETLESYEKWQSVYVRFRK